MLTRFLVSMGITSVTPEDVLAVAKSGSHMYGLATPTSDTDYIIVFREPTEVRGHVDQGRKDLMKFTKYVLIFQSIISSYIPPKVNLFHTRDVVVGCSQQ